VLKFQKALILTKFILFGADSKKKRNIEQKIIISFIEKNLYFSKKLLFQFQKGLNYH